MSRRRLAAWIGVGALALPPLPITLARLTGWTGDLGIVLAAFAPFALLPYAAASALLVALLVRGHRRAQHVVATGLVGVLLVLHGWWFAPLVLGGAPEPAAGAEPITVLGANVEFGRGDAEVVLDRVREDGVDVLVVSEITPRFVAAAERAGLSDVLPHRAGRPGAQTSGTMVFSAEPIEELARVETTFDSLVVRTDGLTLLATHPAPPQLPELWRRDQPLVLAAAREHGVDAVVGDLNATLDHPTTRDLVEAGWRDAVELTNGGWAPTWPAHGESGLPFPAVQIDHVMVRDSYAVTEVDTFEVPDADHLAVLATLAPTSR